MGQQQSSHTSNQHTDASRNRVNATPPLTNDSIKHCSVLLGTPTPHKIEDSLSESDDGSEVSDDTSSTVSSDDGTRNRAPLGTVSQRRATVARHMYKLWANSSWLGFAKLDGDDLAVPLDLRVGAHKVATNEFEASRTIGQKRWKSAARVKMYFVSTKSADIVIAVCDAEACTPSTGPRLKLIADTLRGGGCSVTGHCVLGNRTGVFELLRDKLSTDLVTGQGEEAVVGLRLDDSRSARSSDSLECTVATDNVGGTCSRATSFRQEPYEA